MWRKRKILPRSFKLENYLQCLHCGTFYLSSIPSRKTTKAYYEDMGYYIYRMELTEGLLSAGRKQMRKILQRLPKLVRSRCFEVGPGRGHLTRSFADEFSFVLGMDISERSVQRTKKNVNASFIVGDVEEMEFQEESFDLVVLSEVIEHLENPVFVLKKIYKWLKPQGILYFKTPNPTSLLARYAPERYSFFGKYHYTLLSPKAVRIMARRIGYQVFYLYTSGLGLEWIRSSFSERKIFLPLRFRPRMKAYWKVFQYRPIAV